MMKLRTRLLLGVLAPAVMAAVPALAQAATGYKVSKPRLSSTPVAGTPFTVWGVITPKATTVPRTAVNMRLFANVSGHYKLVKTYHANLSARPAGKVGTKYARAIVIPARGSYAVRAIQYRGGVIVARSALTYILLPQRIDIDSNVNGDTMARPGKPLDIVFTAPSDPTYGTLHFIWGDFTKISADPLIWSTAGLDYGRYDWMNTMLKYGYGALVVSQRVAAEERRRKTAPPRPADSTERDWRNTWTSVSRASWWPCSPWCCF